MDSLLRLFDDDFFRLVQKYPERHAIIDSNSLDPLVITYGELNLLLDRCVKFFQMKGIQSGDVILSIMPNSVETLVCFLATIRGGYSYAPLPCSASGREVEKWISLLNPKLSLISSTSKDEQEDAIRVSGLNRIVISTDSSFRWLPESGLGIEIEKVRNPRLYISTSGSTGEPKALVIDSNRLWSSGCAFTDYMGIKKDGSLRFWNYLPMSYLGGLFNLGLIPLSVGGSVVIDEPFSGKTFLNYWQFVERYDINTLWLIPTIVKGLLELAERRREEINYGKIVRNAFLGTAPIELKTKQRFEEIFKIPLLENFALSETTFFTTERVDNISKRVEASVGEKLPYVDISFNRNLDEESGGVCSEILVKTEFSFLGYLKEDGTMQDAEDADGFIHTGDIGRLNKDGLLIIEGRVRDIIKKGGHFVSLREIETFASQHVLVKDVAAVAITHRFYGEDFELYVEFSESYNESKTKEFSLWLRSNFVKYKWPSKIIFLKEFPRTPSGKVQKHLMGKNE